MTFYSNFKAQLTSNEADLKLWQQEATIVEITELICRALKERRISRGDLAKRMKVSKGYISQILDGTKNLTVRTIADIFTAMGLQLQANYVPMFREAAYVMSFPTQDFARMATSEAGACMSPTEGSIIHHAKLSSPVA